MARAAVIVAGRVVVGVAARVIVEVVLRVAALSVTLVVAALLISVILNCKTSKPKDWNGSAKNHTRNGIFGRNMKI